ncbi:alginate lyase family protein [Chitinophaga caseinilytica]|uniref:Alginate lyase family protein n=1 Tax=Chitinophaga caseinilytica TaxID=2267521 RepID=A0ABZ2ZD13_9BACT
MKKTAFVIVGLLWLQNAAATDGGWLKRALAARREQIRKEAAWAMQQQPVTVTAASCDRSAGGKHDFYSEGDYWWPDPKHQDSPYVQRDGQTNPGNFVAHRQAMVRFSRVVGALAAAYVADGKKERLEHAKQHILAWFADTATRMHPHLLYAQAIKGRATGRGIGIIDTIHLLEVAQALRIMEKAGVLKGVELEAVRRWFREYLQWMTEHPYGKDEMNAKNNHGTCWVMQVAAFASFLKDTTWTNFCERRYKEILLPGQMAADGSFPLELRRTKPYGYALFNLDAMTTICQILSKPGADLWQYEDPAKKSIGKGISFMYPFVQQKNLWPYAKDVMYWDEWPMAHPFLLFAAAAYGNEAYFRLWERLPHGSEVEEVLRNLPVRNPEIWLVKL